ncbi:MAG: DNA-directed RNA polymerase subunit omega [Spirochaetales bacterium]|jgi:DNA-directed RNA polymerase subunit K/omega|nr:DNA-directed RNA polymerase subunit omega [Spirochaetales bacterium]
MSIPLDKMIDETVNIYELTCAIIKRSLQLTKMRAYETRDPESKDPEVKVVSSAINQLISKEVEYRNDNP